MSAVEKFVTTVRNLWTNGGANTGAPAGSAGRPVRARAPKSAVNFGVFLLVPLPSADISAFATDEDRDSFAEAIGEAIHRGLDEANIAGWERLALHLPQQTSARVRRIFGTPDQMERLERACDRKLFINPNTGRKRIHVMNRDLDFHASFDSLLEGTLLVRLLGPGDVLVSRDQTQTDQNLIQLLIGVLEISRAGHTLAKQLIWAYKVPVVDPRIRVNVDFDLLAKGFPREQRCYPLGVEITCAFQEQAGTRMIDDVSLDFSQAIEWLNKVPQLQYVLVTGGADGKSQRATLRDYGVKQQNLKVPLQVPSPGNIYPLSPGVNIRYDRIQAIEVGADEKAITYTFAFFPTAVSYDPKKNVLRLRAHLIPAAGADVAFAPSLQNLAQVAFTLVPSGTSQGTFKVRIPALIEYTFEKTDRQGTVTSLTSAVEHDVELGDMITATPNSGTPPHRFRFEDLAPVPTEVLTARIGRQYAARVVIEAPQDRSFELYETDNIFGAGNHFPVGFQAIGQRSLRFSREYLTLKVFGGAGQSVFYVSKSSPVVAQTGKQAATLLPPDGKELDLNADYDLYVGDLQFFLNLTATPGAAHLAGAAGASTWP